MGYILLLACTSSEILTDPGSSDVHVPSMPAIAIRVNAIKFIGSWQLAALYLMDLIVPVPRATTRTQTKAPRDLMAVTLCCKFKVGAYIGRSVANIFNSL